jgi:hypothetical protein
LKVECPGCGYLVDNPDEVNERYVTCPNCGHKEDGAPCKRCKGTERIEVEINGNIYPDRCPDCELVRDGLNSSQR